MTETLHVVIRNADGSYSIECPGRPHCDGWQDCNQRHEVGGKYIDPDEAEPGDPWFGAEEWEFHGVLHRWIGWNGWTVPVEGCVVREHPYTPDQVGELLIDHEPGRYLLRDYWDDNLVDLQLVGPAPLPEDGDADAH